MKKSISLFTILLFSCVLSLCLAFSVQAEAETSKHDGNLITYDGLSARVTADYPGIRSIYTANHDAIDALVAEGYTVEYGAAMGVSMMDGLTERYTSRDMTVTYTAGVGYTADNANAQAICVYSSRGAEYATERYIGRVGDAYSFAFTTTYQAKNESRKVYEYGLAYVGFVAVTAPGDIEPTISYVYAEGDTFGKTGATYGATTSMYELSTYFLSNDTGDNAVFAEAQSLHRVVRECRTGFFEIDHGESGFVSSSSSTKYTTTLENARAGFYELKLARTTSAVNPDFYVQTGNSGQYDFYDCFLGGGLNEPTGRGPATAIANDGKTLERALFVYLDEGDNLFSYYMGTSTTVYKVTLTLLQEVRAELDGSVTESNSPKAAWTSVSANPAKQTVNVTVPESGYYDLYAVYSAGVDKSGANIDVTVTSPAGVTADTVTYNIVNTQTALYAGTTAWHMKGYGTSYCGGSMLTTYLEEGTSSVTFSICTTAADGSTNATGNRFGFSVLVPIRKTHTVSFYNKDGSLISEQYVLDGADAVCPPLPTYGEYEASKWQDGYEKVTADREIYAIYRNTAETITILPTDDTSVIEPLDNRGYYVSAADSDLASGEAYMRFSTGGTGRMNIYVDAAAGLYKVKITGEFNLTDKNAAIYIRNESMTYNTSYAEDGYNPFAVGDVFTKTTDVSTWETTVPMIDGVNKLYFWCGPLNFKITSITLTRVVDLYDAPYVMVEGRDTVGSYVSGTGDGTHTLNLACLYLTSGMTNDYTVTVPASGAYAIYGLAGATAGAQMSFSLVDGSSVAPLLSHTQTANNTLSVFGTNLVTYADGEDAVVLTQGTHTLRLASGGGTTSLSAIFLVKVGELPTATVSFVDADGSILKTEKVPFGGAATAPFMSVDFATLTWDTDYTSITGDMTVTAVYSDYTAYTVTAESGNITGGTASEDATYMSGNALTVNIPVDMEAGFYDLYLVGTDNGAAAGSNYITNESGTGFRSKLTLPDTYDGSETFFVNLYLADGAQSLSLSLAAVMDIYAVKLVETADLSSDDDVYIDVVADASSNGDKTDKTGYMIRSSGTYIEFTVDVPRSGVYSLRIAGSSSAGSVTVSTVDGESLTAIGAIGVVDGGAGSSSSSWSIPTTGELELTKGVHTLRLTTTANTFMTAIGLEYTRAENINLLVIGNSFSLDATRFLPDLVNASNGETGMFVGVLYKGGSTAKTQWENIDSDTYFTFYGNGVAQSTMSVADALAYRAWDIVVLQQWTGYYNLGGDYDTESSEYAFQPYLTNIAQYVKQSLPSAEIMLHETWAYEVGFGGCATAANQTAMTLNLYKSNEKAAQDIAVSLYGEGASPLRILPSGYLMHLARNLSDENGNAVFANAFDKADVTGAATIDLGSRFYTENAVKLHRDGYHASPAASYMLSALWYNILFDTTVSESGYMPGAVSLLSTTYNASGAEQSGQLVFDAMPAWLVETLNGFVDGFSENPVTTSTVTFVDMAGNVLKTESVSFGGAATAPTLDASYGEYEWDIDFSFVITDMTVTAVQQNCTEFTALAGSSMITSGAELMKDVNGGYYTLDAAKQSLSLRLPDMVEGYYNVYLLATDSVSAGYYIYAKNTGRASVSTASTSSAYYNAVETFDGEYLEAISVYLTGDGSDTLEIYPRDAGKGLRVYGVRVVMQADLEGENDVVMDAFTYLSYDNADYTSSGVAGPVTYYGTETVRSMYLRSGQSADFAVTVLADGIYTLRVLGAAGASDIRCYIVDESGTTTMLTRTAILENMRGGYHTDAIQDFETVTLLRGEYRIRIETSGTLNFTTVSLDFVKVPEVLSLTFEYGDYSNTVEVLEGRYFATPTNEEIGLSSDPTLYILWDGCEDKLWESRVITGVLFELPVYEVPHNSNSNRDEDEYRVIIASDTHYYWPSDDYDYNKLEGETTSGVNFPVRAQMFIDNIIAEWNTPESFDALIINGDLCMNDPDFNAPVNGVKRNAIAEYKRLYLDQLTAAGIPWFVVYGGHDFLSDAEWLALFGTPKNFIVKAGESVYVCCDVFDFDYHLANNPDYDAANPDPTVLGAFQSYADIHEDFRLAAQGYLAKTEGNYECAWIVSHTAHRYYNFVELTRDSHVTGNIVAHTHYAYAYSEIESKPALHTVHNYFSGCPNLLYTGNAWQQFIPHTLENFNALVGVYGDAFYRMSGVTLGTTYPTDASGNKIRAAIDSEGYYTFTLGNDCMYYVFGQYTESDTTKYIYKDLTGTKLYGIDGSGYLVELAAYSFTWKHGETPVTWLSDMTLGSEYATYNGSYVYATKDERGRYVTTSAFSDTTAYYDLVGIYDDGGTVRYIYNLRGTWSYYTPDTADGNKLLKLSNYEKSGTTDATSGLAVFSVIELETDGDHGNIYAYDKNGNVVTATTDGGAFVSFSVTVEKELYRYVLYGVHRADDGSLTYVYKNNETVDLYAVSADGRLVKLDDYTYARSAMMSSAQAPKDLSFTGNPWGTRVIERTNNDDGSTLIEGYVIYWSGDYGTFHWGGAQSDDFSQTYLRVRPSDMGGVTDRTYWSETLPAE